MAVELFTGPIFPEKYGSRINCAEPRSLRYTETSAGRYSNESQSWRNPKLGQTTSVGTTVPTATLIRR
jgi:hypothetical protein